MDIKLEGIISRFVERLTGQKQLRMTGLQSLAVAGVENPRVEMSRAGRRFYGGNQIIANGIAPVTAIPTTTATLALFNGEDAGGKSYCIERVNFWVGSGTPTAGATLMATVSPFKLAAAPTAMATGYGVSSASGSTTSSKAIFTTGATVPSITGHTPAWHALHSNFQLAAANVGQGDGVSDLDGALIVPPQYILGLAILSGTGTTPLYGVSVTWTEAVLDLE